MTSWQSSARSPRKPEGNEAEDLRCRKAGYSDRNRPSVENGQAVSISREALTIKRSGNG